MGQPIVHFEIIGPDAGKLQKFYGDLFDWKVGEAAGPELGSYAMVDAASSSLPVGIGTDPTGTNRVTAYAQVPDLQATLDKAVGMGAKVLMPPSEIPGANVTIAMFADPAGNVMGLTKG